MFADLECSSSVLGRWIFTQALEKMLLESELMVTVGQREILTLVREFVGIQIHLDSFLNKCRAYDEASYDFRETILQPLIKCNCSRRCKTDRNRLKMYDTRGTACFVCNQLVQGPNDWVFWAFHLTQLITWKEMHGSFLDPMKLPFDKSGILIHSHCSDSLKLQKTQPSGIYRTHSQFLCYPNQMAPPQIPDQCELCGEAGHEQKWCEQQIRACKFGDRCKFGVTKCRYAHGPLRAFCTACDHFHIVGKCRPRPPILAWCTPTDLETPTANGPGYDYND